MDKIKNVKKDFSAKISGSFLRKVLVLLKSRRVFINFYLV